MLHQNCFKSLFVAGGICLSLAGPAPAQDVPADGPLAAAIMNDGWGSAELVNATREGDKMIVRVRFEKSPESEGSKIIYGSFSETMWTSDFYVVAGDKKYLLLKDSGGKVIAPSRLVLEDDSPQAGAWNGTFPAPPVGEMATLYLPEMEPLGPFAVPE